uniref:Uncharacterized protein n=1 Tax=Pararge aegeria TaxID=116150 RepID=S4PBZ4_9NEOP
MNVVARAMRGRVPSYRNCYKIRKLNYHPKWSFYKLPRLQTRTRLSTKQCVKNINFWNWTPVLIQLYSYL